MDDIYMLSDLMILAKVGDHLKAQRLRQNITQQSLAEAANVSLSVVKKVEKGEIHSFDSFLRILRTLGLLEVLLPLTEERRLSPNEYYELTQKSEVHQRKRASSTISHAGKEVSEW